MKILYWFRTMAGRYDYYVHRNRIVSIIVEVCKTVSEQYSLRFLRKGNVIVLSPQGGAGLCYQFEFDNAWSTQAGITPYMGVHSGINSFDQISYHQYEAAFQRDQWVWFPSIAESAPTGYEVNYRLGRRRFRWKSTKVGSGRVAYSKDMNRKQLVQDLCFHMTEDLAYLSKVFLSKMAQHP